MKAPQERKLLLACIFTFATVHLVTSQSCGNNAVCVATDVGFSCTCNYGYTGTARGCVNIDECFSSPCKSGEECSDSDGNYVCHCGDITTICAADAQCETNGGTKTCQCQTGYTGIGVTCTDIDECATPGNCDTNANCTNTLGSFICTCQSGYTGIGVTCTDIDECATPGNCDTNANCTNTLGSFICTCQSGYTGNGVSCTDVDECSVGQNNCVSPFTCSNTNGSFKCACGSEVSCHADAQCVATGGISSCVCNDGYMGSGASCTDVDECASSSTNDCHVDADCNNTIGSYTCACKQDFSGDGKQCVPPDGGSIMTISWAVLFLVMANVLKNI